MKILDRGSEYSDTVLLNVIGRMKRTTECGKPVLVYLRKDVEYDIKKFCRGNKSIIINELLRMGLDHLMGKTAS